jgi:hypothetical protein
MPPAASTALSLRAGLRQHPERPLHRDSFYTHAENRLAVDLEQQNQNLQLARVQRRMWC